MLSCREWFCSGGGVLLSRIYTKTGDDGTTGLIGGKRVAKDSPFIEACGSLDELNAVIGVARSRVLPDNVEKVLQPIQENLFMIGAELASPKDSGHADRRIGEEEVRDLEKEIDKFQNGLTPLKHFILPGGTGAGAQLHLARAVARRTERRCVSLSRIEKINPGILCYLNRLSDLFFVLARYVNALQSAKEPHPAAD